MLISHRHGDHTDAHRQAGRPDRRTGPLGGQRVPARPVRRADRRRGDRRRGPADHGDGDTRPHRRLVVVRARRCGADRGHRAGPRNDRHRQRGRQPGATTWSRCSGCAGWVSAPCCPDTAPTWPTWKRWRRDTWRTGSSGWSRCGRRCATLGDDATTRQVVEHVYVDVDEELWDVAEWSVQAQLDYLRLSDGTHAAACRLRRSSARAYLARRASRSESEISTLLPSRRIQPRWAKSASALFTVSREAPTS